jgi:hypothetical protein
MVVKEQSQTPEDTATGTDPVRATTTRKKGMMKEMMKKAEEDYDDFVVKIRDMRTKHPKYYDAWDDYFWMQGTNGASRKWKGPPAPVPTNIEIPKKRKSILDEVNRAMRSGSFVGV